MTLRYSEDRDNWSIEATERLFPPIAKKHLDTEPNNIIYAWNDPGIDRLDKDYGTDAILTTNRPRNVALAIRLRGIDYFNKFGDITIRYDSLYTLGKKLEMQKSIARFMFYAWGDTNTPGTKNPQVEIAPPSRFVGWYLVFLQRLIDKFIKGELKHSDPFRNSDRSSRLIGISIDELDRQGLICKRMGDTDDYIEAVHETNAIRWEQGNLMDLTPDIAEAWANELHHSQWVYD